MEGHTKFCVDAQNALKEFEAKHPQYCRKCRGFGVVCYNDDPSPSGVSLSSGSIEYCDPCGHCIEQDRCPYCGGQIFGENENMFCACGWESNENGESKAGGAPIVECYCLENDPRFWDFEPYDDLARNME